MQPDPPLFPADPAARAAVEQAEAWGDEVLQGAARRALWNALKRDRAPLASFSEGARLGVPIGLAVKTAAPIVALEVRINEATDDRVRADLAALPGMLQRIDDWIAEGVLGGEQLNAADLQIGTSLRLLMTLQDLRETIAAPPGRRARDARGAGVPGRRPADPAAGWRGSKPPAGSAATPSPVSIVSSGARPSPPAPPHPAPSAPRSTEFHRAARSSGSSSSSGSSTNRRDVTSGCGSVSRSLSSSTLAEQQQVDVERPRAVPGPAEHPALLDLDRLAGVEQRLAARARSRSAPRR